MNPTNFFILSGSLIQKSDKVAIGCFEIIMANGDRRYMLASSVEECEEWIRVLRIASSLKTLPTAPKPPSSVNSLIPEVPDAHKLGPDDFTFLKVLGKGNYGKVFVALQTAHDFRLCLQHVIRVTEDAML